MTPPALEALTIDECWELLAAVPVGRVAFAVEGQAPIVLPVNHTVQDHSVVFRTAPSSPIDWAFLPSRAFPTLLAFQADAYDPTHRIGWSVLLRGAARAVLTSGDDAPTSWAGPAHDLTLVRLLPSHVTGRRIVAGQFDLDPAGYL